MCVYFGAYVYSCEVQKEKNKKGFQSIFQFSFGLIFGMLRSKVKVAVTQLRAHCVFCVFCFNKLK